MAPLIPAASDLAERIIAAALDDYDQQHAKPVADRPHRPKSQVAPTAAAAGDKPVPKSYRGYRDPAARREYMRKLMKARRAAGK